MTICTPRMQRVQEIVLGDAVSHGTNALSNVHFFFFWNLIKSRLQISYSENFLIAGGARGGDTAILQANAIYLRAIDDSVVRWCAATLDPRSFVRGQRSYLEQAFGAK
jgi:hypothetical protein